jgi:hypothetical protein
MRYPISRLSIKFWIIPVTEFDGAPVEEAAGRKRLWQAVIDMPKTSANELQLQLLTVLSLLMHLSD